VYAVQDQGSPVTQSRGKNMIAQKIVMAADGSGNENVQTPFHAVDLSVRDGWYIDLPGVGERSLSEPLLVGGMVMFPSVIPKAQPCNGGCGGFIYAVNAFNGDGGLNFLTDPASGNTYDALATIVGCVKGITLINRGSTLNVYASGNGPPPPPVTGPASPGGGTGGGGAGTPTGGITAPAIWHLQGALNVPGRISWHEVTQ